MYHGMVYVLTKKVRTCIKLYLYTYPRVRARVPGTMVSNTRNTDNAPDHLLGLHCVCARFAAVCVLNTGPRRTHSGVCDLSLWHVRLLSPSPQISVCLSVTESLSETPSLSRSLSLSLCRSYTLSLAYVQSTAKSARGGVNTYHKDERCRPAIAPPSN